MRRAIGVSQLHPCRHHYGAYLDLRDRLLEDVRRGRANGEKDDEEDEETRV